jgi:ABC-type branched-subunit amino acid transport system substrate-binding protein
MAVKHLTDKNVDGTSFGQATTELLSMYGKTPVVQPAATAQSAVATTAITTLVTTPTATDIAIAVNSLIARVAALVTLGNQVRSDLVTFGVIKGSA